MSTTESKPTASEAVQDQFFADTGYDWTDPSGDEVREVWMAGRASASSGAEPHPDTVRLDWIVRQADEFSCGLIQDAPGDGLYRVTGMGNSEGVGATARIAIDTALAQAEAAKGANHG